MSTPILKVVQLSKSYPLGFKRRLEVLSKLNFTVNKGELVSFIGINGAGKTTLLKLLVGINQPDSGSVQIFDQPVTKTHTKQHLGYLPENPQFYQHLNAYQFLAVMAGIFGLAKTQVKYTIKQLLLEVGLQSVARQPISTFSKGMRQRLGFAQAVINNPSILFLDEPLDGLDPEGRLALKESITQRKKAGTTIILCSHILSDITELSDRIGILHHGHIIKLAPPQEITQGCNLENTFIKLIHQ